MKKLFFIPLFLLLSWQPTFADSCSKWPSWFQSSCHRLNDILTKGDTELMLTGYAWHNRYTYTPEKIKSFNENAWGGGLGKGYYDEKGNWHGLFAIAFMDSHNHVQPLAGYVYMKMFGLTEKVKIGGGLTLFVTSRVDIYNSIPFPGILPWFSIVYDKYAISGTYIPGSKGAGNVLFLTGKYTF